MNQSDIMVVDDNPANLKLLEDMLVQQGHEVRSFPLGRLALAAAAVNPPDLILLDINMPEMNGYEVCEQIKAARQLAGIPVIFLSALDDTQDKVKAFRTGAVDYICKPFQFEEVHARVETHLKLHVLQRALKCQNERLEEAVATRTRELAEANGRLMILDRAKTDFLNLISHEFRTPLNGLLGVGQLILHEMPASDENRELQELFEQSRRRILSILEDALLLSEIDVGGEAFRSAPVCLHSAISDAIERVSEFAESRCVTLSLTPSSAAMVAGNKQLLVKALHSLLETVIKFSDEGEAVLLLCKSLHGSAEVVMETRGRVIPGPALAKFFDLFSISEASTPGGDLGLGPAVAYRILSLFGGSVRVENVQPPGIRITVSLNAPLLS